MGSATVGRAKFLVRDSKPVRYAVEPSKPLTTASTPAEIQAAQLTTANYAVREGLTKEQLKELLEMLGIEKVITGD